MCQKSVKKEPTRFLCSKVQQRRKKTHFIKSAARCNSVESPTLNAGTKAGPSVSLCWGND